MKVYYDRNVKRNNSQKVFCLKQSIYERNLHPRSFVVSTWRQVLWCKQIYCFQCIRKKIDHYNVTQYHIVHVTSIRKNLFIILKTEHIFFCNRFPLVCDVEAFPGWVPQCSSFWMFPFYRQFCFVNKLYETRSEWELLHPSQWSFG